jgi:hypothetical protein
MAIHPYKAMIVFCLLGANCLYAQKIGINLTACSTPNTTLDVNGSVAYRGGTAITLSNGANSDIALSDYSLFRITGPTAAFSVTGFTGGVNGRILTIVNATTQTMTITHQATSSANNQIQTNGSDITLAADGVAFFIYNSISNKWVLAGGQGFSNIAWNLTGNSGTTAGTNFIGTTDAKDLVFKTNGTEKLRIQSNGNVGVGHNSPSASLHLYGTGQSGFIPTSHGITGVHGAEIAFSANGFSNPAASIQLLDYNAYSSGLCFNVHKGTSNGGTGIFADNWPTDVLQAMTIDNRGYVGIGTSSPGAALHVSSNNAGLYNDILLSGYNNGDIPVFNIRRARGTDVFPVNLINGDGLGGNHYYGYVNGGWSYLSGVYATYKGNGTTNLSNLSFMASNSERMVIDENGDVGIGCADPQYKLHVIGTLGVSTSIRTPSTSTGATTACSDMRYKTNIHPLSNALEKVLKIRGVTYDWRVKDFPEWKFSRRNQIGVIAQELEKIYPELVETDEKGYKSVDYSKITPILVEAIKEQQTTINKQQNEIDNLKKQNAILNAKISELDTLKADIELIKKAIGTASKQ